MDYETRSLMLLGLGLAILFFGIWTALLVFAALTAESGGKNSDPVTAVFVLWPLCELIWSWVWVLGHPDQYSSSPRQNVGNFLVFGALLLPPGLMSTVAWSRFGIPDWLSTALYVAMTTAGCQAARWLWSRGGELAKENG